MQINDANNLRGTFRIKLVDNWGMGGGVIGKAVPFPRQLDAGEGWKAWQFYFIGYNVTEIFPAIPHAISENVVGPPWGTLQTAMAGQFIEPGQRRAWTRSKAIYLWAVSRALLPAHIPACLNKVEGWTRPRTCKWRNTRPKQKNSCPRTYSVRVSLCSGNKKTSTNLNKVVRLIMRMLFFCGARLCE